MSKSLNPKEKALQEIENIKFPESFSEKKIQEYKEYHRRRIEEKFGISVWYNPDCGCNIDIQVLLDRYPMSPKIHSRCPQCKKGTLLSLTDPILFYNPVEEKDFKEKDICSLPSYIRHSFQDEWLTMYFYQYAARSFG